MYLAGDENVKRNSSSLWQQARGYVSQPCPGAARTMSRSQLFERRHPEKDRGGLHTRAELGNSSREASIEQLFAGYFIV